MIKAGSVVGLDVYTGVEAESASVIPGGLIADLVE